MVQTLPKTITVQEFLESYPHCGGKRYELHNGIIIEMSPPQGKHEEIIGFLTLELSLKIRRLKLPWIIPKTALLQSSLSQSAFCPDILLLNRSNLHQEKQWGQYSTLSQAASTPLVIEVVSSNWRDDYYLKLSEYEAMQIPEYWIVDYAAYGGRKFIGSPKQPTLSIYQLMEEEYQVTRFQGSTPIVSPTFPHLNLTAEEIFQIGVDSV